jgi:hypothetical protein
LLLPARINSWEWGTLLASKPHPLARCRSFPCPTMPMPLGMAILPVWCGDAWQQVSPLFSKARLTGRCPREH